MVITSSCATVAGEGEALADSGLALTFELVENQHGDGGEFLAELTLANQGEAALSGQGWSLYFSFGRPIRLAGEVAQLGAEHINGDFWRLSPSESFVPLAPGEERGFRVIGRGSVTRRSDAPAGPYFVSADGVAQALSEYTVAPFRDIEGLKRHALDQRPVATTAELFQRNRDLAQLPIEEVGRLLPTPVRLESGSGQMAIDTDSIIRYAPGLQREAELLAEGLEAELGGRLRTMAIGEAKGSGVFLEIGEVEVDGVARRPGDEAYTLQVIGSRILRIVGSDAAGVFYGTQTLRALLESAADGSGTAVVPEVVVEDAPRFPYRGIHLDVSRNFHRRETVEKLLDRAAFYKLNRFHFHLTDDEGWRLPVTALPELTEVGARRGHTVDESDRLIPSFGSGPDPDPAASAGSGHYTREEVLAILRYARDRHIQVIPEIDVPGHARAAIKAMAARRARLAEAGREKEAAEFLLTDPGDDSQYRSVQGWSDNVIDVCLPSTYRFLETVVDEIVDLWAEAEAPLDTVHVGGDEVPAGVWQGSPACQAMLRDDPELETTDDLWYQFLRRLSAILAERDLATAGWEEIGLTAGAHGTKKHPSEEFLDRDFRPYVWNNIWGSGAEDLGYQLANAGYEIVLCNATNLYFDLAYDKHPEEVGYAWAGYVGTRESWEFVPLDLFKNATTDLLGRPIPAGSFKGRTRLSEEGRRRVSGIQGQLWAENSKSPAILDYQTFPKLLGLAERAWAASPAWAEIEDDAERQRQQEAAWNEFANRLGQRELPRLDRLGGGVLYRLPPPGAARVHGRVEANAAFPGMTIRYTTDGSEPTAESMIYTGPVEAGGTVKLRVFDSRGRGSRVATVAADD
jgi:hexosaminidase